MKSVISDELMKMSSRHECWEMVTEGFLLRIKVACGAFNNRSNMWCICFCKLFWQAKVRNFCVHILVQKYVTALYIPMYNPWFTSIVQIVQSFTNKTECYYLPESNVCLVPMTDFEDVPFAASTATFSLETQFNESLLRLGPAEERYHQKL